MASSAKIIAVCLVALFAVEFVAAQNCPPITEFQPCLQYSMQGNPPPPPGSPCCTKVNDPKWTDACLCSVATSGIFGSQFSKVISFPKECGRRVPPGTECNNTPVPSGTNN